MTNPLPLIFVWHLHQPFFVPDTEVLDRVRESYLPLVRLHSQFDMPLTLNITGYLLHRLELIAPSFLDEVRSGVNAGNIEITASGYSHPLLPLLPPDRARYQIDADLSVKQRLLDVCPLGFWPTDLAWAHWLVPILATRSISWTFVDSSSAYMAGRLPAWIKTDRNGMRALQPADMELALDVEASKVSKLRVGGQTVLAIFRNHELSSALIDNPSGPLFDPTNGAPPFLERVQEFGDGGADYLALGHDGENVTARTFRGYRLLLEQLVGNPSISLTSAQAIVQKLGATAPERYLPASTFEIDYKMWLQTPDDLVFMRFLDSTHRQLELVQGLAALSQGSDIADTIHSAQALLATCEDAGFLFWRFVRRTREPFYEALGRVGELLDDARSQLVDATTGREPKVESASSE
jgi:hypothetical protein